MTKRPAQTADPAGRKPHRVVSPAERALRERILHSASNKSVEEAVLLAEIDDVIARLDVGIPRARKSMNLLLSRLRTTRIPIAA